MQLHGTILNVSEAQAEAMISPDCIADDGGRETIASGSRPIALMAPVLQFRAELDKAYRNPFKGKSCAPEFFQL